MLAEIMSMVLEIDDISNLIDKGQVRVKILR